jgi:winged helix domain-containing protein/ATPase family protein associated with various cellular activities (AAA)
MMHSSVSAGHARHEEHVDARALAVRLDGLRERARLLVEQQAADDPDVLDPWRGLRQTADSVMRLLARPPAPPRDTVAGDGEPVPGRAGAGAEPRIDALAREFGLSSLDTEILLIAIAPDLDRGFEGCYGYLNDDVTRRRATVGLALELAGRSVFDAGARGRFGAAAPLTDGRLLEIEETERPFLTRGLRVPDRVIGYLLGDDFPDDALAGLIIVTESDPPVFPAPDGVPGGLIPMLAAGPLLLHLRGRHSGADDELAVTALHAAGRAAIRLEVGAATLERTAAIAPALVREARLRGAGLVIRLLDAVDPGPLCDPSVPVILLGEATPRMAGGRRPVAVDVEPGGADLALWRAELGPLAPETDLARVISPYRLSRGAVRDVARTARQLAAMDGTPVTAAHVRRSASMDNAWKMGAGVRRVEPAVGWGDLVLPGEPAGTLRELADRIRNRDQVLGEWGLRVGGGRGHGVTALFAGESGTGKTLAAEVVAHEVGLDLYVVELSALIDKYVGETEKNLERIFEQADRVNAMLLFDEADAIFGKRSETKDAHDRYANMESSYLLQRLESFDGVAVLTTNLRGNIDDAFTRRFDLMVHFPFPDKELRRLLWAGCLTGAVPVAADIDLDSIASEFELAGGSIRAAATTAAYLAAASGRPVGQADLLAGARREYHKQGRLVEED